MTPTILARLAVIGLGIATLSGCATTLTAEPGDPQQPAYACASWVDFPDEAAMFAEARLVVSGVVGAADGTLDFATGPGERHLVTIEQVHKGDYRGAELRVAALRDYCVGTPPEPASDPLVEGQRVMLYLNPYTGDMTGEDWPDDLDEVEAWSTLTPYAGVSPLPDERKPELPTDG